MLFFLSFFEGELNDLVQHGLRGLRETLPAEQDLTTKVKSKGMIYPDPQQNSFLWFPLCMQVKLTPSMKCCM